MDAFDESGHSYLESDVSVDPVTMRDALQKIRALRGEQSRRDAHFEDKISALTQELITLRKLHIDDVKKVRAAAKEREQVLLHDLDPEGMKERARAEAAREAQSAVDALRGDLDAAVARAERAEAGLRALEGEITGRQTAQADAHAAREAELQFLQQTVLRDAEEGEILRLSIERERELLSSERQMWMETQSQAADALAAYRQRAAKAELNARWVSTVQQSLQAKDVTAKAATAATELLLDLIEAVRTAFGAIPVDAVLHKALRVAPTVSRATQSGVDVAVLLASGLPGFSEVRATANTGANAQVAAVAAAAAHQPQGNGNAGGGADKEAMAAIIGPQPTPSAHAQPLPGGHHSARRAQSRSRSRSRSPRLHGVALGGHAADVDAGGLEGSVSPVDASRVPGGGYLGIGASPVVAKQRELLHRARLLHAEAEQLSQPREVESPRWSPVQEKGNSATPERQRSASPPRSPPPQAAATAAAASARRSPTRQQASRSPQSVSTSPQQQQQQQQQADAYPMPLAPYPPGPGPHGYAPPPPPHPQYANGQAAPVPAHGHAAYGYPHPHHHHHHHHQGFGAIPQSVYDCL